METIVSACRRKVKLPVEASACLDTALLDQDLPIALSRIFPFTLSALARTFYNACL